MSTPRVVVAEGLFDPADLAAENGRGRVELVHATLTTPDQVAEATNRADAVMVSIHPMTEAHVAALGGGVRIIGRAGVGLDSIDLQAAATRGVAVFHTPDYCAIEVAEHAVALILALRRRLVPGDRVARSAWRDWRAAGPIKALADTTVGLVGCGRIGSEMVRLLEPFGIRIVVFDPYTAATPTGTSRIGSLGELLSCSDVVSLHCPLTDETRGIIDASALRLMVPGAYLINVARGALLDENAVAEALASGQLGGAGLDVLVDEPPAANAAILKAPNVILTPHLAWYSDAALPRVFAQTVDGVLAYLEGREPPSGRLAVRP